MSEQQENTEIQKAGLSAWIEKYGYSVGSIMGELLKYTMLVVVIALATIFIYRGYFEKRIVTVDLQRIVAAEISNQGSAKLTDGERAVYADRFNRALEAEFDSLQDGRTVVMVAPAVIRGGRDVTAEVQAKIKARMAESK